MPNFAAVSWLLLLRTAAKKGRDRGNKETRANTRVAKWGRL